MEVFQGYSWQNTDEYAVDTKPNDTDTERWIKVESERTVYEWIKQLYDEITVDTGERVWSIGDAPDGWFATGNSRIVKQYQKQENLNHDLEPYDPSPFSQCEEGYQYSEDAFGNKYCTPIENWVDVGDTVWLEEKPDADPGFRWIDLTGERTEHEFARYDTIFDWVDTNEYIWAEEKPATDVGRWVQTGQSNVLGNKWVKQVLKPDVNSINGEWVYYNHLTPYYFNVKKDGLLNNAVIERFTTEDNALELFTKVRIIDNTPIYFIVENCSTERVSLNVWKQTINLIEPTEILKGYILENLSITQPINPNQTHPIKTLYDEVVRLIKLSKTHKANDPNLTDIITINLETETKLQNIDSPEFSFTEMTLFDALVEIGIFIDAIPRLTINNDNKYELFFEQLDLKNKTNYVIDNLILEKKEKPISNYANEVVSNISNLNTGTPIVYPGENLGVFVDAGESMDITNDNAQITLPYKIKKVISIEAVAIMGFGIEADYTNYVYEYGEWASLTPLRSNEGGTEPEYQRRPHTIYYKYNTNVINFAEYFVLKPSIRQTLFKIKYIPIYDTKHRENNNGIVNFTVINNQNENLVEGSSVSSKLKNYIKRMKYGDYIVGKKYKNYDSIPKIGNLINEKYVITDISYTKYPTYYDVTLSLSEGYTRNSEFIRAKQEIRNWEIPADGKTINRLINYKETVKFSLCKPITSSVNAPSIKNIRDLFNILFYGSDYNGLFCVINFDTKEGTIPILNTAAVGVIGNNLTFNFKAVDNTLIGLSKAVNFTDAVSKQSGVTYTDEYGNFENMTVGVTSNIQEEDALDFAQNYPISTYEKNNNLLSNSFIRIDDLVVLKDASEVINFTYQLAIEGEKDTTISNELPKNVLYQSAQLWTPYVYFLNKKVYDSNEKITNDNIIEGVPLEADGIDLFEDRIVYTLMEIESSPIPTNYESVAIGIEQNYPQITNWKKPLIIQNDTESIKNEINNYQLTLYFSK